MTRPGKRTQAELRRMQRAAVARWDQARARAEQAAQVQTASREVRMDLARQMDVLREQHRGIVERTEAHRHAGAAGTGNPRCRAVVVHRNEWFGNRVRDELGRRGVEVVSLLENGARGVGVVVAEQPDLLVVEDTLPMLPGEEVVRKTRHYAPDTLVVAQVAYEDRIPTMLDAGARAAFTRRVPPAELVREALVLLGESDLVDA